MPSLEKIADTLQQRFSDSVTQCQVTYGEITLDIVADQLLSVCTALREESRFSFDMLMDICGVDYLHYGQDEWATQSTTLTGFSRGVEAERLSEVAPVWDKPRFAVIYHLLSLTHNQRLRLRVFVEGEPPIIDSVNDIWNAANWFERETFDLFGILFNGHPDLRRILTDYGFIGHPFRKDFPVSGHVEMRYDAQQARVVYEPVDIEPRVLVPKVIRSDNRYAQQAEGDKRG